MWYKNTMLYQQKMKIILSTSTLLLNITYNLEWLQLLFYYVAGETEPDLEPDPLLKIK